MEQKRKFGVVEKVFAYGKCGFICTARDEHYYFSQKSFGTEPRRMKVKEAVTFLPSEQNGKPMAVDIDAECMRVVPAKEKP